MWLATAPAMSHGQTAPPDEAKVMAARAAERIRALQREADDLAAKARSLFNDLRKLELDRAIAQQRVTEAEAALAAVTAQRDTAAERVERIEAERVANTPGVAERLVSIYKRGRGGYAQLLLSSDDPRAFGRLTRGVAAIATLDRVRVDAHRRTLAAERNALADLENQRIQVASSQKAATKANQDLEKTVKARNNAIDAIDARRDLAAKYVAELQAAQAALQRRVGEFSTTTVPNCRSSPSVAPWTGPRKARYDTLRPQPPRPLWDGHRPKRYRDQGGRRDARPGRAWRDGGVRGAVHRLRHARHRGPRRRRLHDVWPPGRRAGRARGPGRSAAASSGRSGWPRPASPRSISRSASTAARSIPYNGSGDHHEDSRPLVVLAVSMPVIAFRRRRRLHEQRHGARGKTAISTCASSKMSSR